MKKYLALLLVIFDFTVCSGQNAIRFSGHVEDAISHQPIEFVNVSLLNSDSTFIQGTVTDSLGRFSISVTDASPTKKYILQTTHLSYNKQSETSVPSNRIILKLAPNGYTLSEVDVKAIRTKVRNGLNMEYTVDDELRKNSALTTEILEKIPSVFVDVNSTIYVKGSSNILILKDGIKISHNSLLDLIPSRSVQKVIVSYHVPSKYADGNYTAVINIITKRIDGITLQIKPMFGFDKSWGDTKLNLNLEKGKSSLAFYYQLHYRQLTEHRTSETSNRELATDSVTRLKVYPYHFSDNELFSGYTYHPSEKLQLGIEGYWDFFRETDNDHYEDGMRSAYDRYHERYNTQNYKAYAAYSDSITKMQLNVSYNNENVNDKDEYELLKHDTNQKTLKETYHTEFDYETYLTKKIELNTGANYSFVRNSGRYGYEDSSHSAHFIGNTLSAYAESNFTLGESLILDAGINVHSYHRSFPDGTRVNSFNFYPKASLSYSWKEVNNLNVDYSSNIEEPTIWALLPFIREEAPGVFSKGSPNLKPERNSTLSATYNYSKGDASFSFSPYYKRISNSIVSQASSYDKGSMIDYTNLRRSENIGVDLSYSNNLFKWWLVNLYANGSRQSVPQNTYYKHHLNHLDFQLVNLWTITPKISFILQYVYNGKELGYNGYSKSDNTSLACLTYKVSRFLKLYLMYVQPLDDMKEKDCLYYEGGYVKKSRTVDAQRVLVSCTFTLSEGKKSEEKAMYQNEDKKY